MNILHLTKKYPPALGGDAIVVSNLQHQQEAAGHTVVIVTSNCKEVSGTRIYKFGLRDTPAQLDAITIKRLVSLAMLVYRMFFIIRRERPDVIHTHSIDMAFFASFAARFFKVPMVHTFHIVTFYDQAQSPLRRKTELWLAKKAGLRMATAPNNYDVNKLYFGGLPHTKLLPNGVDVTFWRTHPGHAAPNDTFTFVAIGRLESQKNFSALIQAAAMLARQESAPFKVVIIGEGSEKKHLEKLIQSENVEHIVTLAGRKTPHQVRAQFAQAHAAVCTSTYETTPLTLLEAWAAGLPVITTPVGIIRDAPAASQSALIVPLQDVSALATAMHHYMTDDGLRTTIAHNGHTEVKKYEWPKIAQVAEAIYRSTL